MTGLLSSRRRAAAADPFAVLGLQRRGDLTDDQVRAAWRRVAAATHPDREDGGDPQRFAAAAGAYTTLRTRFGRGEALADLAAGPVSGSRTGLRGRFGRGEALADRAAGPTSADTAPQTRFGRGEAPADLAAGPASGDGTGWPIPVKSRSSGSRFRGAPRLAARVRAGRPLRLALRVLATVAASAVAVAAAGFHPAAPALVTGAVTWLACTARRDLAPPR